MKEKDLREVLGYLNSGKIGKSAVLEVLVDILKNGKADLSKYKGISDDDLEKEVKKIVKANKGAPINALMGEVMKKFRGKVDGKKVMMILKRLEK